MSRRESRESAFKLLYQMEIQKQDFEEQRKQFIDDQNIKENELDYFEILIDGVSEKKAIVDSVYSQHLKKWNLDRIAKIDQTILRIATYEIMFLPMVPFNVSVSEAVFLSKKYSTDEARSFINGILGNLSYIKPKDDFDAAKAGLVDPSEEPELEEIDLNDETSYEQSDIKLEEKIIEQSDVDLKKIIIKQSDAKSDKKSDRIKNK